MTYGLRPPNYRLPPSAHIGRVRLQVGDLSRSIEFYEGKLGFQRLGAAPGHATFGAGDAPLIELVERKGAKPVLPRSRLGLFHFAILLPDRASLGRAMLQLHQAGIDLGMADHGVSEALYLSDPDGLGIEIYADRPRESWRAEGAELAMGTDPLDTGSLLRAAAGEPWSRMPAGTVIGHVHLHVGDLALGKRFYHEALGLDLTHWSYPHALFLSAGGYHHHLGINTWAPHAPPPRDDEAQLLQWELVIPDDAARRAALESVRAAGLGDGAAAGVIPDPWGTKVKL
ncbi:MAG TPA: VOC family protein [Gemmatimonadaceae bacterium]|nr:VOC family protein [Gemmatimonadaceae bacterium]